MNTTEEPQHVSVFGNWFYFSPKQIKLMDEDKVNFLTMRRQDMGFVRLPESLEDLDFRASDEGKRLIAEARKEGIAAYLDHHRKIVRNNQESLRQDLKMANIDTDPASLMSDGELASLNILVKYQDMEQDEAKKTADKANEMLKRLKNIQSDPATARTFKRD